MGRIIGCQCFFGLGLRQPGVEASGGDLACETPTGEFFEDALPHEVDDGSSAKAGEADDLSEWDGGDGSSLAALGCVAGDPAGLDRGAGYEAGAAGVGLGIELDLTINREESDGLRNYR